MNNKRTIDFMSDYGIPPELTTLVSLCMEKYKDQEILEFAKMNNTITITKENAQRAYNSTDNTGKELLSNLLGQEHFLKIQDIVKTFEDALSILGFKEEDILTKSMSKTDIAEAKLKLIIKVLNEGKEGIPTYYPYFYGGSWSVYCYFGYGDGAYFPVGLAFRLFTPELALYVGEQFKDLYKIYMGYE